MSEERMVLVWEDGVSVVRPALPGELPDLVTTEEMVNAERDRRLVLPFDWNGKGFQRDAVSVQRINGAVSMALAAMAAGALPNTVTWVNNGPFQWIAADNSIVTMTPAEVISFGMACAAIEARIVFAARTLKDMTPIPLDYTDDSYW